MGNSAASKPKGKGAEKEPYQKVNASPLIDMLTQHMGKLLVVFDKYVSIFCGILSGKLTIFCKKT